MLYHLFLSNNKKEKFIALLMYIYKYIGTVNVLRVWLVQNFNFFRLYSNWFCDYICSDIKVITNIPHSKWRRTTTTHKNNRIFSRENKKLRFQKSNRSKSNTNPDTSLSLYLFTSTSSRWLIRLGIFSRSSIWLCCFCCCCYCLDWWRGRCFLLRQISGFIQFSWWEFNPYLMIFVYDLFSLCWSPPGPPKFTLKHTLIAC